MINLDSLKRRLSDYQGRLEIARSFISSTPCIVASVNGFYTVGLKDENFCMVEMGIDHPIMFSEEVAVSIVENFTAWNFRKRIDWHIFSEVQFLSLKIHDIQETIKIMSEL